VKNIEGNTANYRHKHNAQINETASKNGTNLDNSSNNTELSQFAAINSGANTHKG
jgi:hypothetical protein